MQNWFVRAQRFQIRMGLRYRILGESEWREGRTENVSRSGVLFRCAEPLEPGTSLEMRLMPRELISAEVAVDILCRGRIIRLETPPTDGDYRVAAGIADYEFLREGTPAEPE